MNEANADIGPKILKEKFELHNKPEVNKAVNRLELHTGKNIPNDPTAKIQVYLDRLEKIVLDPDNKQPFAKIAGINRPKGLSRLREMVMDAYVRPHKAKLAQGAARVEERAAHELGFNVRYGQDELEQRGEIAVKDLENSLDPWIIYLSDSTEPYPSWFRYYAFRSILGLSRYDKVKGEFPKRSAGTNLLFPDIDSGALAFMRDMVEASSDSNIFEKLVSAQRQTDISQDQRLTMDKVKRFANLSFAKQYAEGIRHRGEITPELLANTKGEWITYKQGSDPLPLWKSLQNKGVPWCTAGLGTAQTQLESGDFHVYYTLDKDGKLTIPRIAIRMQEGKIFEARGIADNDQNIESNMLNIAEGKINQLPGAEKYRKATSDMKVLTTVEQKINSDEKLNRDELVFLYEINSRIEGFGRRRDPRIESLLKTRKTEQDMLVIFECTQAEIAHSVDEISEHTKAYVGKMASDVFTKLPASMEQIYTSFPRGKIRTDNANIGKIDTRNLVDKPESRLANMGPHVLDMLESGNLELNEVPETIRLVFLSADELGFTSNPNTMQVIERAKSFGLDVCPQNVALQYVPPDKFELYDNGIIYCSEPMYYKSDIYPYVFAQHYGISGLDLNLVLSGSKFADSYDSDIFVFRRAE